VSESENDFGFLAVDESELRILVPGSAPPVVQNTVDPDQLVGLKTALAALDVKVTALRSASPTQIARIEEKIDRVLSMELGELNASMGAVGSNISQMLDEVEERSNAVRAECREKLLAVEGLILPLLVNLMKNPHKTYIHWPNRSEKLQSQIDRITTVTRSLGV